MFTTHYTVIVGQRWSVQTCYSLSVQSSILYKAMTGIRPEESVQRNQSVSCKVHNLTFTLHRARVWHNEGCIFANWTGESFDNTLSARGDNESWAWYSTPPIDNSREREQKVFQHSVTLKLGEEKLLNSKGFTNLQKWIGASPIRLTKGTNSYDGQLGMQQELLRWNNHRCNKYNSCDD